MSHCWGSAAQMWAQRRLHKGDIREGVEGGLGAPTPILKQQH